VNTILCASRVSSGSGVKPKAAEEGESVECQQVINLKLHASQRVNCTKQRKTELVRAISHDKKFKYREEMLPVNNVPGYNLHMYQPVSIQGQPTIVGQAIPPTQITLHIQTQQFLSSNLQPLIDNPIPSPSHYNNSVEKSPPLMTNKMRTSQTIPTCQTGK
jgi:hypothetical protein